MKTNISIPGKRALKLREARYKPGSRVELVLMDDDETELKPGDLGTVSFVKWDGTIFVDWDCGSKLGAVYGVDKVKRV